MSALTIQPAATPADDGHDAQATALFLDELQQSIPLTDGAHCELRHLLDGYDPDTALRLPGVQHPKDGAK